MTERHHPDTLQRFVFEDAPIRGAIVRLDDCWQQVLTRADYPLPIRRALGELMVAGALLAANLKFDGTMVLQIQGRGALKMLVVEANSDRTLRATAKWSGETPADASLTELLGEGGTFVITLDPEHGEPWQGIVELKGESIAQMLTHYMQRSEQLETRLQLEADEHGAAGLLLQRLPDGQGDPDGWGNALALAETLKRDELLQLDGEEVLYRLFHRDAVRLFEPESVAFFCSCSRERVADMLKMLGGEEVGEVVLEQGSIEIACDFCKQRYVFDEQEVSELFDMDVVEAVRAARH